MVNKHCYFVHHFKKRNKKQNKEIKNKKQNKLNSIWWMRCARMAINLQQIRRLFEIYIYAQAIGVLVWLLLNIKWLTASNFLYILTHGRNWFRKWHGPVGKIYLCHLTAAKMHLLKNLRHSMVFLVVIVFGLQLELDFTLTFIYRLVTKTYLKAIAECFNRISDCGFFYFGSVKTGTEKQIYCTTVYVERIYLLSLQANVKVYTNVVTEFSYLQV